MIKQKISKERWDSANSEEKLYHNEPLKHSYEFYKNLYKNYFSYLDIKEDLNNKSILEIGPAKISALLFCKNYSQSYIVEPIIFNEGNHYYDNLPISFIREKYETCNSPIVDEIWLLNVLQHVLDPDAIVEKCKKTSKIIRFFEPINTPIEPHHPHSFTLQDYVSYFGDSVKYYGGNMNTFHMAECAYGVYENK